MPAVSSTRYTMPTSSVVSGSYRPGALERPYYSSGTYVTSSVRSTVGDRTTEYRSRYSDVDGRRERKSSLVEYRARAPSVADSEGAAGGRYRSESRSRDASSTRSDGGKTASEPPRPRRAPAAAAAADLAMSAAEFRNKYSPANYIPLTQRIAMQQQQQNQNNYGEIARSKSISSDIGRPPAPDALRFARRARNSTLGERVDSRRSYKESSPPSYKRGSLSNGVKDTNGNEVPTYAEIRRRFDANMAVTKLPANEGPSTTPKYPTRTVDQYLEQLKKCENGTPDYSKLIAKDRSPVPVHQPKAENGHGNKWQITAASRSNSSSSDVSVTRTLPEPRSSDVTVSFSAKLPATTAERLASIKSQLDPSNPIGKILEKSTVIKVENGDADATERRRASDSPVAYDVDATKSRRSTDEQPTKSRHTTDFASYIPNAQPEEKESPKLKFIDDDEKRKDDAPSPAANGFENKLFEHEVYLKKRTDAKVDGAEEARADPGVGPGADPGAGPGAGADDEGKPSLNGDATVQEAGARGGGPGARRSADRDVERPVGTQGSGLNGLRNIGNTCFMNSVVQCLSSSRPLLRYVAGDAYRADVNTTLSPCKGALIKAFASVIKELWRAGDADCVVNTTALKQQVQRFAPRFMGYSQQDAQEFLRYLLEGLHEDVNRVTARPPPAAAVDDSLSDSEKAAEAWARYARTDSSHVADAFVGQLKSTLRCTHCQHDSVTFDPFWDLSLPIPARTGTVKLQQCLQHFTKQEEMDGDEKPTCSKCGVRRKCLKWFTVQRFPQLLVLHLKRFSPTERFRGKLSCLVEFPLAALDLSAYAAAGERALYSLYAVSNHSGTTYSGHYTAYCKHPYSGDWHEYNDSRVSSIAAKDVVSPEAYVLFYERTSS